VKIGTRKTRQKSEQHAGPGSRRRATNPDGALKTHAPLQPTTQAAAATESRCLCGHLEHPDYAYDVESCAIYGAFRG
jgi:hypothetical protein